MDFGPCTDGTVDLTPGAERAFRLECERRGGYAVDPDEATRSTYASTFMADCKVILDAVTFPKR